MWTVLPPRIKNITEKNFFCRACVNKSKFVRFLFFDFYRKLRHNELVITLKMNISIQPEFKFSNVIIVGEFLVVKYEQTLKFDSHNLFMYGPAVGERHKATNGLELKNRISGEENKEHVFVQNTR